MSYGDPEDRPSEAELGNVSAELSILERARGPLEQVLSHLTSTETDGLLYRTERRLQDQAQDVAVAGGARLLMVSAHDALVLAEALGALARLRRREIDRLAREPF